MLAVAATAKLLTEIALLALAGQWAVGLLAGAGKGGNPFYRVLQGVGRPWVKAVALGARLDQAWYDLALVLIHAQRFEEAAEAVKKNTALQPLSPYGWYRLAQVWLALGQPGKARKVFAHLGRFEPRVAAQLHRENAAALAVAGRVADAAH
jgi:predicted Zn-dependent protease